MRNEENLNDRKVEDFGLWKQNLIFEKFSVGYSRLGLLKGILDPKRLKALSAAG